MVNRGGFMSVIDLGSGKDLNEIRKQEEDKQIEYDNQFKESVESLLFEIKAILDRGDLSGIYLAGTTKDGTISPTTLVRNFEDFYKLQFVCDDGVSALKDEIAMRSGLWGVEEELL